MDFNPCAYPHRDGIEMRDGLGDLKGFTLRHERIDGRVLHEAYAMFGDKIKYLDQHTDMWRAYGMIEMYYATQDYYGDYESLAGGFYMPEPGFVEANTF
ncbi:hypothetical protein GCM10022419_015990 [Nonomuraea rosea]|uniref:Uncharacterized protein n=1 Tax=Nonomuraea rosea TaxID=638574 RepID=A0ABP6VMW4_9ACTN